MTIALRPLGANWGLNDTSTFSLFLTGANLEGFAAESGNLYLDNLVLSSGVPVPGTFTLMLIALLGMAVARARAPK